MNVIGGNYECAACGAVVAWEGDRPTDCLNCGVTVVLSGEERCESSYVERRAANSQARPSS